MTFQKPSAKDRILNALNYKRPPLWIGVALFLILLLFRFGLLSDLDNNPERNPEFANRETHSIADVWAEDGVYEFDGLLYLSPLSSSTFDYAESRMQRTRFTISEEIFEINYPEEDRYRIEQPTYTRETMTEDMILAFEKSTFDKVLISEHKKIDRFAISTQDHIKTNFYLYALDDQLWLSSYADNTADKSEITMSVWKLKRPPTYEQLASNIIETMSTEEKVGQMFFARCRKDTAIADLKTYALGGLILFGVDIKEETRDTLKTTIQSYQDASARKLLIGVDEEGGKIVRISRYPEFRAVPFHSPQSLYAEGGYPLVAGDTAEKATLLKSLGFNVNLAPVCDVSTDPANYIYDRTFGKSGEETAQYVKTVVETMHANHIGCVLKHFPGYGDNADTHTGIAIDNRSFDSFLNSDFIPFRSGIEAGAGSILFSHTIVTCMDPDLPASLSPAVHGVLRDKLGFDGVMITDDLAMAAIKKYIGDETSAVMAIKAGNDLILSSDFDIQIPSVLTAVENGTISEERINESVLKILIWKLRLGIIS